MKSIKKKRRKIIWHRLLILCLVILIPLYLFTPLREMTNYLFLPESTRNLLRLDYTLEEINYFREYLDEDDIVLLANKEHQADLIKFIGAPNFCLNRLERYQNKFNDVEDHHRSVVLINLHADIEHYSETITVSNPNDLDVLVNKFYRLPADFTPELVNMRPNLIQRTGLQLRTEANDAFIRLTDAAREYNNYRIIAFSAFRSYQRQAEIYNNFVRTRGQEEADLVSARPGHSEHQTGLSLDVTRQIGRYDDFDETPEYRWLANNAHRFGFIIRYPKNTTYITGYIYEPWHIRYIGVEIATIIFNEGITLEEYFVIHRDLNC